MKSDVYQRITDHILADLEKGVRPWHKPWSTGHADGPVSRPLRANGVPYRGVNVILLWSAAMEHGFTSPVWMTFKQSHERGAHIRRGEKGSLVVYANTITRMEINEEAGEEEETCIPFLKGYTVFNNEQIEGAPCRRENGVVAMT